MIAQSDLGTSCVELISSIHGRKRRLERDIAVKDLQTAVKYGTKEPQRGARYLGTRYKITYNNIVYITDDTMTKEVTSFSLVQLPLETFQIDKALANQVLMNCKLFQPRAF